MKMDLGKLFVALVGLIIAGFGIAAMSLQIQTTEVWINGGGVASITPNYSIFTQPLDMLNGKISGNALIDVLVGWGIELTFIMCLIGFEHAHAGVRRGNSKLADVFVVGCIIVAAMNWLADYNYGSEKRHLRARGVCLYHVFCGGLLPISWVEADRGGFPFRG